MLFINGRLAEKGFNQKLRSRASLLLSDHLLAFNAAVPLKLSLTQDQYAILERNNKPIIEAFNRDFLAADPIAVARPDQIGGPVTLEPLSDTDKAIAAKLADFLIVRSSAQSARRSRARPVAEHDRAAAALVPS